MNKCEEKVIFYLSKPTNNYEKNAIRKSMNAKISG